MPAPATHDFLLPTRIERTRGRTVRLQLDPLTREFVLRVPPRCSKAKAEDFLRSRTAWMASVARTLPAAIPFVPGAVVPVLGDPHTLVHRPGLRGSAWGENELAVGGDPEFFVRRVRTALMTRAREALADLSCDYAQSLGARIARVGVREMRSQWGSCTSKDVLTYHWRLIFAPFDVMAYVVAHETAHLRHLNHGPAFWATVAHLCPAMKTHRAWLKRHGQGLYAYGVGVR